MDDSARQRRGDHTLRGKSSLDGCEHHLVDDGFRRVERAGGVTKPRLHDALEHLPQHVRRDGVNLMCFAHTEPKFLEQAVKDVAPHVIGESRLARPHFNGMPLEESPVEIRYVSKGVAAPLCSWTIQRCEAERLQRGLVERQPGCQAIVQKCPEIVGATVKPALGLHEVQEQNHRHR